MAPATVAGSAYGCSQIAMDIERASGPPACDEDWSLFASQLRDFALFMLDPSGRITSWSASAERLNGYTADEALGQHFSVFYTAEDIALAKPAHALEIAAREGTFQEEGLRVRRDGTRFWAMATMTALRGEDGHLRGFAKLTRDISERKASDAALLESEAKYRALFEHSNDAILLTSADGAILSSNPAAHDLFGYSEDELHSVGRERLVDESDPRVAAVLGQHAGSGETVAELTFVRKGGERFEASVSVKGFDDEAGRKLSSLIIHDVTEKKKAELALRNSEERFRLLYENAPIGITHIDLNGIWTYANRKFGEIVGYSPAEIVGLSYIDLTPPDDRDVSIELTRKLLTGQVDVNRERRMLRKDGSTTWIRLTARMLRDDAGTLQYGIVLFEDIAGKKRAEMALRQSEERFRATFEHAPLGIAECTLEGRFITVNAKLMEMLGYTRKEFEQLSVADITHPGDMEQTFNQLQKLVAGEVDTYVTEKRYLRKDGSFAWVNITTTIRQSDGQSRYVIAIVEDVTGRKKAEEDLRRAVERSFYLANHDTLTGLANRAQLNDRLTDALNYARRDGHSVAVHVLDLDRFKSINDTLGHHIGDLLLKEVAARIKAHIRATDLAVRLGGDEFVIVQTHLAAPSAAAVLADTLVQELGRTYMLEGQEVHSGTSIGIALFPDDVDDQDQLIKCADLALYEAKNRGRYNFQTYREEMGLAARESQQVERELKCALRDDEFCLHYQPQFNMRTGRISGIEALIRWRHPKRGLLTAAEFIDSAENAGLTLQIGEWTLRNACAQHCEWVGAGLAVPLTINGSLRQLRHPRFLQILKRVLDETGLPPSLLQFEIRENVLLDQRLPLNLLKEMKNAGVLLALADFGAELTALSSIHRFPLDLVKPGQGLVKELPARSRDAMVLAAIVSVAHERRIKVCAEGVETVEQFEVLRDEGCDSAQGYLLSSPLEADEMTRLIEADLAR
jgi:diguanylate cyclase (GGDEF)-like protein/PAS domain S-box-containing protein